MSYNGVLTNPVGNTYPDFEASDPALSLGMRVSGSAPSSPDTPITSDAAAQISIGGQKSILWAGLMFVGLLIALMYFAQYFSDEKSEFRNIKASAYNALVIGLAAVTTIPIYKFLFSKLPVPGVKAWVSAV